MTIRALPLVLAILVAACGEAAGPVPDPLAGSYLAVSAESAIPLANELTTAFSALHPGMTWTVRDVGSTAALALVSRGEADAGFISREPSIAERAEAMVIGLGFSAQVLVVDPSNPINGLSAEQLQGIFSGAISDWSAVGGTAGPIHIFVRPASSPTRTALDALLRAPGADYRADAISIPDAKAMLDAVRSIPGAIGMVSALHIGAEPTAPRPIAVAGIAPTRENTASGVYAYRRPLYLMSRANETLARAGATKFRDFVHGEAGQQILRRRL